MSHATTKIFSERSPQGRVDPPQRAHPGRVRHPRREEIDRFRFPGGDDHLFERSSIRRWIAFDEPPPVRKKRLVAPIRWSASREITRDAGDPLRGRADARGWV